MTTNNLPAALQYNDTVTTNNLPVLPSNARYVFHENECYDWGTAGWLIRTGQVNVNSYKYFMLLNSSVKGPYMPAYAERLMHWTDPFIK